MDGTITIWVYRIEHREGNSSYLVDGEDGLRAKSKNLLSTAIEDAIRFPEEESRVNVNFSPPQDFILDSGRCYPLSVLEIDALVPLLQGAYKD